MQRKAKHIAGAEWGRAFGGGTLHFEYEICPACSLSVDKEGRLTAAPFPWRKINMQDLFLVEYRIYNDIDKKAECWGRERFMENNEWDTAALDDLRYLKCSRYPECKYFVHVNNTVLLSEKAFLLEAQAAFQVN